MNLHHCPYLKEVMKLKQNKGLSSEEKIVWMQNNLKLLNDHKNRLLMANRNIMSEGVGGSKDYERLRQEGEMIKNEIAKSVKARVSLNDSRIFSKVPSQMSISRMSSGISKHFA